MQVFYSTRLLTLRTVTESFNTPVMVNDCDLQSSTLNGFFLFTKKKIKKNVTYIKKA